MAKKARISLSLDRTLIERADKIAKLTQSNRSEVINGLALDALEQTELTAHATGDPVVMGAMVRALSEPGVMRSLAESLRADLTDEQLKLFGGTVAAQAVKPPAHVTKLVQRSKLKKKGR